LREVSRPEAGFGSIAVENKSSDSILFKSANEAEAALTAAYGDFRNEYFELDYFVNGDAQSDDAYAGAITQPISRSMIMK